MEIIIDSQLVRDIVSQETDEASAEIEMLGVIAAYRRSLERLDQRLSSAKDAPTLACKAGCSWCCYFSVDVRPVEVFNILEFVERQLTPNERDRIRKEIATNKLLLEQLSEQERATRNIKCPFLASGRCTIYAARPQTCRNYHATDATGCQRSYEQPNNVDIDPEFAPVVYQVGGAHVDAFSKAMSDADYDTDAYELSTALSAAMSSPDIARQRFEAKLKPFVDVQGNDVPLEFVELDE